MAGVFLVILLKYGAKAPEIMDDEPSTKWKLILEPRAA